MYTLLWASHVTFRLVQFSSYLISYSLPYHFITIGVVIELNDFDNHTNIYSLLCLDYVPKTQHSHCSSPGK